MVVFVPFERARVRAVRVCTLPIIGAAGPFLELYWRPFGATALADFRWWWCYGSMRGATGTYTRPPTDQIDLPLYGGGGLGTRLAAG